MLHRTAFAIVCFVFVLGGCSAGEGADAALDHSFADQLHTNDSAADSGLDAVSMDGTDATDDTARDSGVAADASPHDAVATDAAPRVGICQVCTGDPDCGPNARCASINGGPLVCLAICNPDVPSCPGSLHCVLDFSISPTPVCTPAFGTHETCNGADDDCNGTVDEGLGSTTCGSGACMTTVQNCVAGVPQTCTAPTSMPEVCNGIDDNCNGMVDDGLGSISCGVGACARTVQACVGGTMQSCTPGTPAGSEICSNGIDDNCNGSVDEGCISCAPQTLTWNIPAGTTGGPTCITTGGGTCMGTVSCSGSTCYDDRSCGMPHCNTLRCNDGTYVMYNYCSVTATCAGGTMVATGFSW